MDPSTLNPTEPFKEPLNETQGNRFKELFWTPLPLGKAEDLNP